MKEDRELTTTSVYIKFARIGVEIIWVDSYSDVTNTLKNLYAKLTRSVDYP